jgi:ABC-2 type transport system permease protein/capsular polysaccharide transport system permease protein
MAVIERLKSVNRLFVGVVVVPTIVAFFYFGFLADDIYTSESRFVVRGANKGEASPLSLVLTGGSLGGGGSDESNAVVEYLQSRRALAEVDRDGLVTRAYGDPDLFWLDRFGSIFGDSREQFYRYFQGKLGVAEGTNSKVIHLTVTAFAPRDARQINARLLDRAEELVNGLSKRAQADAITIAREEVAQAEASAREAAVKLSRFRNEHGIIDPELQAATDLQMIAKVQDELVAARTQLLQLETYTPKASQIPFLRAQVRSLEREIDRQKREIAGGSRSLSTAAARYQELQFDAEAASKLLTTALASLQEAQAESRRKRAYIERIADPSLPDYATRPRRVRNIIATFILGLLAWGVLSMLIVGIREHRD